MVHQWWFGISVELDMTVALLILQNAPGSAIGFCGVLGEVDTLVITIAVADVDLMAPKVAPQRSKGICVGAWAVRSLQIPDGIWRRQSFSSVRLQSNMSSMAEYVCTSPSRWPIV